MHQKLSSYLGARTKCLLYPDPSLLLPGENLCRSNDNKSVGVTPSWQLFGTKFETSMLHRGGWGVAHSNDTGGGRGLSPPGLTGLELFQRSSGFTCLLLLHPPLCRNVPLPLRQTTPVPGSARPADVRRVGRVSSYLACSAIYAADTISHVLL